jgi:hypothetical protein
VGIDDQAQGTISLTAFRRRPWPLRWDLIAVRQPALERLRVPPAAASRGTAADFFQVSPCRHRATVEQLLLTR